MKIRIVLTILALAVITNPIVAADKVLPAWEILNSELGRSPSAELKSVATAPLIGALKRALYKYPDQASALCQTAAKAKCGDSNVIRQITEMGIYTSQSQAAAIVEAVYAQCPSGEDGIKKAMNAKMVREPKEVVEDEPTPEPTVPPNVFNFPPPPPMTPFIPVTPVTDTGRRK